MNFMRLINHGAHHAFCNMAFDEAISAAVRQKRSPPTLRLYQWDRPSLSIGYFQKVSDIDIDYCNEKGYPVVRRQTGGRAILHDSELTYSVSASSQDRLFHGSLLDNYTVISNAMIRGLKMNGIDAKVSFRRKRNRGHNNPACFKAISYGEITVKGKKIIGSAQKRFSNGFLQHGSILLSFNARELWNVLGRNEDDFHDIAAVNDCIPAISLHEFMRSLTEAFETELKVKLITDDPTDFEVNRAQELEESKYATRQWNYMR